MTQRYVCPSCLDSRDSAGECRGCERGRLDSESGEERERLVESLRKQVRSKRKKYIFVMEALAIVVCAGFLFVGMALADALGATVLDWGVKLSAVAMLAVAWKLIPGLYGRYFAGRPARILAEVGGTDAETGSKN